MKLPTTLKQIPGDVLLQHIRRYMYSPVTDQQILDRMRREIAEAEIRRSLDRCRKITASEDPIHDRNTSIDREFALQDLLWPIAYPNSSPLHGNTAPEGCAK